MNVKQWSNVLRTYYEIARISFWSRAAYPANLLARSLTIGLRVWIFYAVYSITFASAGSDTIGDLTLAQTLWILGLSQSFQASTRPPAISSVVQEEIQSGQFAYTVSRPYSFILYHLFSQLGRCLPTLFFNLVSVSALLFIFVGPVSVTFTAIVCGLILLFLGLVLDFFMTFIVGLCALWIEETFGLFVIFQRLQMVLGGQVLPLSMFPGMLKTFAEALPFAHLYYSACLVLVAFDPSTLPKLFATQLCWLIIMVALATWVFQRGMRAVSVNGG